MAMFIKISPEGQTNLKRKVLESISATINAIEQRNALVKTQKEKSKSLREISQNLKELDRDVQRLKELLPARDVEKMLKKELVGEQTRARDEFRRKRGIEKENVIKKTVRRVTKKKVLKKEHVKFKRKSIKTKESKTKTEKKEKEFKAKAAKLSQQARQKKLPKAKRAAYRQELQEIQKRLASL